VGAIDRGVALEEAASASDLIYLSQPIAQILTTLERLGPMLRPECLVTDAGSTKALIVRKAQQFLPAGTFLGGHPMAGKEQRGAHAAEPGLFRGRPYVVTQSAHPNAKAFLELLTRFGAELIEMSPEEHDRTVALTSHLPQLLSTVLAATLEREKDVQTDRVFGPGLVDMTRLAMSSPEVWASVLDTNLAEVESALERFEITLRELRKRLREGQLTELFLDAGAFARQIRQPAERYLADM
jgi:prephenate dehydrogenase